MAENLIILFEITAHVSNPSLPFIALFASPQIGTWRFKSIQPQVRLFGHGSFYYGKYSGQKRKWSSETLFLIVDIIG